MCIQLAAWERAADTVQAVALAEEACREGKSGARGVPSSYSCGVAMSRVVAAG